VSTVLLVTTLSVGVSRTLSVARNRERRVDRGLSPIAAPHSTSARAAVQIGGAGIAFLVAYVTLQFLHALGRDPKLVVAVARIPLFARFVASAACALPAGVTIGCLVRDHRGWLRMLPALLAAAIALFVVTIAVFS
jgi:hypothetical protein